LTSPISDLVLFSGYKVIINDYLLDP